MATTKALTELYVDFADLESENGKYAWSVSGEQLANIAKTTETEQKIFIFLLLNILNSLH
ncbi:hypothetical protein [Leptospira saintgironsiae]|uniref:hypothetical protein n=1 Tax=Leptospira saintgironsiae TaxID=2023183 RepID=UPI001FCC3C73|nr:hypothetical protein [Leptospira saintgironsiae]